MPSVLDANLALVTLANAKTWLKAGAATTDDNLIELMINRAGGVANRYCGRHFKTKTFTEYYDGDGHRELIVRNFPITSLTSLNIDATRQWGAESLVDASGDVQLDGDAGIIRLWNNGGVFFKGKGNVKVVYVAGYKDTVDNLVPDDLQEAALLIVQYSYKRHYQDQRVGLQSETIGDRTMSYSDQPIPTKAKQILDSYKMPMGTSNGY